MTKESLTNCTGNECFEGFVVDMMTEIAKQPVFQHSIEYELYIVPDGLFGNLDPESMEWNGIMGEIISGVRSSLAFYSGVYEIWIYS